uniref:Uncharacterized protein n=1 Tax=Oryza meridionalis TaxID=40149 RepID=A0A0E0EIQ0_9ORYZ
MKQDKDNTIIVLALAAPGSHPKRGNGTELLHPNQRGIDRWTFRLCAPNRHCEYHTTKPRRTQQQPAYLGLAHGGQQIPQEAAGIAMLQESTVANGVEQIMEEATGPANPEDMNDVFEFALNNITCTGAAVVELKGGGQKLIEPMDTYTCLRYCQQLLLRMSKVAVELEEGADRFEQDKGEGIAERRGIN